MDFLFSVNLPLILVAGVLLTLAGVIVVLIARRGRRTDDHPICSKCGYDLTGRPESSTRCAECGADLTRPRAIRTGHRARRAAIGRAGVLALLIGLGTVGWSGYRYAQTIDWIPYLPLSWLVKDLDNGSKARQQLVSAEILRRLQGGQISKDRLPWLIDHALDQLIVAGAGPSQWEEVLVRCFFLKRVSPAQEDRYVEHLKLQVATVVQKQSLAVPADVLPGRPFFLRLTRPAAVDPMLKGIPWGAAVSVSTMLPLTVDCTIVQVELDDTPVTFLLGTPMQRGRLIEAIVQPAWEKIADREKDLHDLTVQIQVELSVTGSGGVKKLTTEVEVKRQVHVIGGVAGDRTI